MDGIALAKHSRLDSRLRPRKRGWTHTRSFRVIDVTDAAESTNENGHRYFRKSPWVSSDVLMMLRFGLGPEARGLVRSADSAMWRFPSGLYRASVNGGCSDGDLHASSFCDDQAEQRVA